jgi:hypothetical protein
MLSRHQAKVRLEGLGQLKKSTPFIIILKYIKTGCNRVLLLLLQLLRGATVHDEPWPPLRLLSIALDHMTFVSNFQSHCLQI